MAEAERAVAGSPQLFRFTNAVKTHFDEAGRVALIDMLWDVAHADGAVCAYEENLLRRVAGLLYVSDRDRGAARRRARARAAAEERTVDDLRRHRSCIKCKYMDCVEVCPVDCFYEGENMLVIHPDECMRLRRLRSPNVPPRLSSPTARASSTAGWR